MDLTAQLDLDVGPIGTQLSTDLSGPTSALQSLDVPVDTAELSGLADQLGDLDTGGITNAVSEVVEAARTILEELPLADDLVGPIVQALDLAESIVAGDGLAARIEALTAALAEPFGESSSGTVGVLLQLVSVLRGASEGQLLLSLVAALTQGDGARLTSSLPATEILETLDGLLRLLGGLMALESVIAESRELTTTMARSLDPNAVDARLQRLLQLIEGSGVQLAAFLDAVDETQPAEVRVAVDAVASAATQLNELAEGIALAMARGEATLVYLDVDAVLAEVTTAVNLLRGVTVVPLRAQVQRLADALQPFTNFDLTGAAASGLGGAITLAEAEIGNLAAAVQGQDVAEMVAPVTDGIQVVTDALGRVEQLMVDVQVAIQGALSQVRDLVAALPFETIADTIRTVLAPVTAVIDAVRTLIEQVQAALELAADATETALGQVDAALDAFKGAIDTLFADARTVIESVDIETVISQVSSGIQAFADEIAKAQLKPYFDTAIDVIDTTANIVDAVPFGLLPSDMKADVDEALRPIREVDVRQVEAKIEDILQIEDGEFRLRDDVEAALLDLQHRYDALIAFVADQDPRVALATVDEELSALAERIREIEPAMTLAPVQEVVDQVRAAVGEFDLSALLQPVRDVFDEIIAAIDRYSPAQLIVPLEERLDAARTAVTEAIGLDTWSATLDELRTTAVAAIDLADPVRLEPQLVGLLRELQEVVELSPTARAGSLGQIVAQLLSGIGLRIEPSSFERVLGWLDGSSASDALQAATAAIHAAVEGTLAAVDRVDPTALAGQLTGRFTALEVSAQGLAARLTVGDPDRDRLLQLSVRLNASAVLSPLATHRARYRASLQASLGFADSLRRTGLSEAVVATTDLLSVIEPLRPARDRLDELLGLVGLAPGVGLAGALRAILAEAPPERLAALFSPLIDAVQDRANALLTALLDPVQDGITNLQGIIAAIDLTPLREAVDAIVDELQNQLMALHPDALLAEPLAAFAEFQTTLRDNDPVAAVTAILENLRELIARVLDKAHLETLLEAPLAIYDHILEQLRRLQFAGLLDPIFDQLDALALQVDEGLDGTVVAFEKLQAALPSGGGGSSASASVGG